MKTKHIQLAILAFIAIATISIMSGCAQGLSPAESYAKTWSGHSFEARMEGYKDNRMRNAKDALKEAKQDFREKGKNQSQRDKISKIWERTAQLKAL